MVFTEQQLQVKKLVDVQQDIEIDALNNGVGALSSTMQNGFTQASNNFNDIQNSLGLMNNVSQDRYNELTGSVNVLSNAMTQGFLDMGNTVVNTNDTIQGQFNDVNNYVGGFENNVNTALQGIQNNFYDMENDYLDRFDQVNANISDSINNFNEQITNELSVNAFSADTIIYNVSAAPISSLTALGYDSNGKIIPVTVIANQNVVLPENADYIYTGASGTPYAGMADTAVSTNENLITSHAVYNTVNTLQNDISYLNTLMNLVVYVFNGSDPMEPIYSGKYVDYNNLEKIELGKGLGPLENLCSSSPFGVYYNWDDNTNTLKFYSPLGPNNIKFNSNMNSTFAYCTKFNQDIPASMMVEVDDMNNCFMYCTNLNQNIQIPDSYIKFYRTFMNCTNLNQNILLPNQSTEMRYAFMYCTNLNQNIHIPNYAINIDGMFWGCYNFNYPIILPSRIENMNKTFMDCTSLNQNIYLYSDIVTSMDNTFNNCPLLSDKYIHIRSSIPLAASNSIYNALVNNYTGINWTGRVVNDL